MALWIHHIKQTKGPTKNEQLSIYWVQVKKHCYGGDFENVKKNKIKKCIAWLYGMYFTTYVYYLFYGIYKWLRLTCDVDKWTYEHRKKWKR